jgi:hypothetical protein
MGWGTGNLGGSGGGGGLNFRVIGGTSAPSNPKPNDVWVNTNEKITCYVFSSTTPIAPIEGMVWVTVGASSSAEMNILKKGNTIMLYPMSAKQYVSGAWVEVTAKTYLNGKWTDWAVFIISGGNTDNTIAIKDGGRDRSLLNAEPGYVISYQSNSAGSGFGADGIIYFEEFTRYDLSGISEIVLDAKFTKALQQGNRWQLAVWETLNDATTDNPIRYIDVADGVTRLSVDTLSGEYLIGFNVSAIQEVALKVSNFYLK